MTFETSRILLRQWQPDDAEYLYEYTRDPEIAGLYEFSFQNVEKCREIIETAFSEPEVYAIFSKRNCDKKTIGCAELKIGKSSGLKLKTDEAELCSWIGAYKNDAWDQDFTSDVYWEMLRHAFEDLKLSKLWTVCYETESAKKAAIEEVCFELFKKRRILDPMKKYRYIYCFTASRWKMFLSVPGMTKFNPIVYVPDGFVITRYNGKWYQTDGYMNGLLR
ncbi:MAG: GNAT family N-acetyltransferase [Oscillospiraceae bacterium]|nr:GNAT family N-acetyltransferase [Oscillospiraceae bacterium]